MDINKLKESNEAINMLNELDLPLSLDQLEERDMLETTYLNENVVPQLQSHIQSLVEQMHIPFCLVVDYKHGSPVQVRIVENGLRKVKAEPLSKPRSQKIGRDYIKLKWNNFINSLPKGSTSYREKISQPYHSLSKLLRVMQTREMMQFTSILFNALNLPTTGKLSPKDFLNILEPEQFVEEVTKDGKINRIVLWSQSQKVSVLKDGKQVMLFKEDGATPIMYDKAKKIKDGQWTLKTLCELMAQKDYFAHLHSVQQNSYVIS